MSTRTALVAERRRIARDLHDGLAQDLAFIVLQAERLEHADGEHPVVLAARRALEISRGQIADLEASDAPTIEAALDRIAGEFRDRDGVEVSVTVATGPLGPPQPRTARERSALVRIAREAIANAIRHGGARHVDVRLGGSGEPRLLAICDDGCGLDAATARTAGTRTGMRAMRERAAAVGAGLVVGDGPAGGACVEVLAELPFVGARTPDDGRGRAVA